MFFLWLCGFSLGFSRFCPQSKNMYLRLIGNCKLSKGKYESENNCVYVTLEWTDDFSRLSSCLRPLTWAKRLHETIVTTSMARIFCSFCSFMQCINLKLYWCESFETIDSNYSFFRLSNRQLFRSALELDIFFFCSSTGTAFALMLPLLSFKKRVEVIQLLLKVSESMFVSCLTPIDQYKMHIVFSKI